MNWKGLCEVGLGALFGGALLVGVFYTFLTKSDREPRPDIVCRHADGSVLLRAHGVRRWDILGGVWIIEDARGTHRTNATCVLNYPRRPSAAPVDMRSLDPMSRPESADDLDDPEHPELEDAEDVDAPDGSDGGTRTEPDSIVPSNPEE